MCAVDGQPPGACDIGFHIYFISCKELFRRISRKATVNGGGNGLMASCSGVNGGPCA